VIRTRGVIPKQTVASLAELKARVFAEVSSQQQSAVNTVWKTIKSFGGRSILVTVHLTP
jgi:hypothetical protein